MGEQAFEYRIQKFLENEKGYMVINCARSKPFDLIAIKDGRAFPIECKGLITVRRNGKIYKYHARYTAEQRDKQIALAEKVKTNFFLINQSKKIGKILLTMFDVHRGRFGGWGGILQEDLRELFEN